MYPSFALLAFGLLPLAAAHCKITTAKGDLGGAGTALGITANSGNSQSDVTVFQGSQAKTFGETPGAGNNNPQTALPAVQKLTGPTLPQLSAGGALTMTLHQINADGAGPMACSIDTTGTGASFQAMQISTNVPGTNGVSNVQNTDFPLVATVPAGVTACAGKVAGVSGVCFVKCQNPAGPFGGVVPVQIGSGKVGGGNSTSGAGTGTGTGKGAKAGSKKGGKEGAANKGKAGRAVAVKEFLGY